MNQEIHVKSQKELDSVPVEFCGTICIEFGTFTDPANVYAFPHAYIVAYGNSIVNAHDNSIVTAWDNSTVTARNDSTVIARDTSIVTAWDNSTVIGYENSTINAHENSTVIGYENSTINAHENSIVTAWGNVQVCDMTKSHLISVKGNARIVRMPQNGKEYCDFYGLPVHDGICTLYKAVHKDTYGVLYSDYDNHFTYKIGEVIEPDMFDNDSSISCSHGIHAAHLAWAYEYGRRWSDLAILEVEAEVDHLLVPIGSSKVRAPQMKVVREIPKEEYQNLGRKTLNNP